MNSADQTPDEQPITSVLGAADTNAAPPDADVLAKLKAQSTAAFNAAGARKRFRRRAAWFGAMAAAVAIGVGLYFWWAARNPTLREVFAIMEKAGTLHIRIDKGGKSTNYWY